MTIKEEKQLRNYIKGLVRESIGEMDSMPSWWNDQYGDGPLDDEDLDLDDELDAMSRPTEDGELPEPEDLRPDDDIAGLNELRTLAESMARDSFRRILSEKKKKDGKRRKKKEKTSSRDKTVISKLNADGTNAAHYYYKLYGVENGTEEEKAAARSKGYKKAKGKKNDTGVPYKFSSKERNRLSSLLTDRG